MLFKLHLCSRTLPGCSKIICYRPRTRFARDALLELPDVVVVVVRFSVLNSVDKVQQCALAVPQGHGCSSLRAASTVGVVGWSLSCRRVVVGLPFWSLGGGTQADASLRLTVAAADGSNSYHEAS